jgi:ADP-heptose:LPS heptosyltransferase
MSGLAAPAERLLVIRFKSIGDVIFTLPAVHALRELFPQAQLDFLTATENADLTGGFPGLHETLTIDRRALRRVTVGALWANTAGLALRLRRQRYSLVVDFQGYGETALLCRLAGAPRRWGRCERALRAYAYTHSQAPDPAEHPALWNCRLLASGGLQLPPLNNQFVPPAKAMAEAHGFFAERQLIPGAATLLIQPFTSSPHKDWPLARFVAVARHFRERGVQVIFGGGPADQQALRHVEAEGFVVSAGVPLMTAAGLVGLASLTLGGNTGLLHLGAAMGRRVLMLLGNKAPGAAIPLNRPGWAMAPDDENDLARISTQTVIRACEEALQEGRPR